MGKVIRVVMVTLEFSMKITLEQNALRGKREDYICV